MDETGTLPTLRAKVVYTLAILTTFLSLWLVADAPLLVAFVLAACGADLLLRVGVWATDRTRGRRA